jgi:AcrR family transcriptional regulator
LSASAIVACAVEVADAEGLDALTIRRLATELGVGPMSLYSHVRGKDDILDRVADHVLGAFVVPVVSSEDPGLAVREVARALLAMMRRHPSVVQLLSSRTTTSAESMKGSMDDVIGALRSVGFAPDDAVRVYAAVMVWTLGFASYQLPRPWGGEGAEAAELRRQRRHFYASLPADDFPHLVELSEPVSQMATTDQFEFGLETLVAGLRTTVAWPAPG